MHNPTKYNIIITITIYNILLEKPIIFITNYSLNHAYLDDIDKEYIPIKSLYKINRKVA